MIKRNRFSQKLQNDPLPRLQFRSEEYVKENMALCPIFTFETTKNISCAKVHIR